MLVGRSARAWSLAGAAGAALAFGQVGCGSRTSMLDPDVYTTEGGNSSAGGSASQGGKASGGKPSISPGGSAAAGAPTSGGKAAFDVKAATAPCAKYCEGFAPLCPARLDGQDCNEACLREVNGFGKQCQAYGIKALNCLSPFFKQPKSFCEDIVAKAMLKCGTIVDRFQTCKDGDDAPEPQPQPDPDPVPNAEPSSCPSMGSADSVGCFDVYSCQSGTYLVSCSNVQGDSTRQNCTCEGPNTTSGQVLLASPFEACKRMVASCN